MDLSAIRQIQARIAEIEGQFNLPQAQLPGADFAARLRAEIDRSAAGAAEKAHTVQATAPLAAVQETARTERTAPTDSAQPDLARTIHAAAQKYAVDPKLVSAVAEVESGGAAGRRLGRRGNRRHAAHAGNGCGTWRQSLRYEEQRRGRHEISERAPRHVWRGCPQGGCRLQCRSECR